MKTMIHTGLALFLATMGFKAQAQSLEPVDFNKVNGVIEEIIQSSVRFDEVIKGVKFRIDPASDLQKGKLTAQFVSVVGTTPWAKNQESQLKLELGTRFKDLNELKKDGGLKVKAQAKTPVIKLIRYFSAKALGDREIDETDEHYAIVKQLSEVSDVNELYAVFLQAKEAFLNDAKKAEEKSFWESIRFSTRAVNGQVQAFKVEATKPLFLDFFRKLAIRTPSITITKGSITAGLTVGFETYTDEFNAYIQDITQYLVELQNRRKSGLNDIKKIVGHYFEDVRAFLSK